MKESNAQCVAVSGAAGNEVKPRAGMWGLLNGFALTAELVFERSTFDGLPHCELLRKALLVGPPGSLRACVESLEMMVALVRAGQVEFLLPGHGLHVTRADAILCHLQSRAELLRTLRQEVLNGWRQHGGETDVTILTRWLVERSPLFRLWSHAAFPKHVVFPFNMVSIVLTEEGLMPQCDQLS